MAYSLDFRKRILKVKEEENLTFQEVADRFKLGIRSLFRWTNKIEPQKSRNKPATKVDMKALAEDILKCPDAYQSERAKKLGVKQPTIHYALKRLKITYKKNPSTS